MGSSNDTPHGIVKKKRHTVGKTEHQRYIRHIGHQGVAGQDRFIIAPRAHARIRCLTDMDLVTMHLARRDEACGIEMQGFGKKAAIPPNIRRKIPHVKRHVAGSERPLR